jgi:hypothetical protein
MSDIQICQKCGQNHPKCSAHRRKVRTPEGKMIPCGAQPIKNNPNRLCADHGGKSLTGINHPSFKSGRYSKYVNKDINARLGELQESRKEGEFLTLKHQIELVEVRISQIAQKLGSGDSALTWMEVKNARDELQSAIRAGKPELLSIAIQKLNLAIKEGEDDYRSWDELFKAQRHYERLLSSERKKMIEDKYMLSVEEVMMLLAMIGVAIKEKVQDAGIRRELVVEVQRIAEKSGFTE